MELDCRGLACPKPVMAARDLIAANHPEKFDIRVDNEAAVENVSRFLARNGYEADMARSGESEWVIVARRSGTAPASVEPRGAAGTRTLVFIPTEVIGQGDDALGAKLMQNFLATLPELGSELWRLVLVNGGVKLAATSGPCLEALKNLAAAGVSILVCGTCLAHYGLMEQKQVGETTNMLDIVTSFANAEKVIRP